MDPLNYSHVQEVESAKEAWVNLCEIFYDTTTWRRVVTLQRLETLWLSECTTIEDYQQNDAILDKGAKC